ncbi:YheC/YheD family protein [Paenibacillus donghaensis]|uniref:YheC/YheD family endospore coat-associated protein n=1 Tax=Paenibacillus donghaensis TaxID=414771 RepID=UPI001883DB07|nr:YheC/YheD family protein [Paenibacillus donghaensis]MBE9915993.1 YheC/YheD family protein [Paenibacillus donghaensis]
MWFSYIGILMNAAMHRGIPHGRTGPESLANYEEAARIYGLIPCFIRLQDIDMASGQCTAYILKGKTYTLVRIPIPRVIHNRAIHLDAASQQKINLMLGQGYIIFNGFNRYGKDEIHQLLQKDPLLSPHLPETQKATSSSISEMMRQYDDLIIKPCTGSIGRGILRLHRSGSTWKLTYSSTGKSSGWKTVALRQNKLPALLRNRIDQIPYLIQERISLAEFKDSPYDLRVSVQRGISGEWGITGIYAKAASARTFVSNVAQGAKALGVDAVLRESLPHLSPDLIVSNVRMLALQIAEKLEQHLPNAADLGLDIGLSTMGKPYFIECNGRDQRYGFRKAGLTELWKGTYRQPMAYARYLLGR